MCFAAEVRYKGFALGFDAATVEIHFPSGIPMGARSAEQLGTGWTHAGAGNLDAYGLR